MAAEGAGAAAASGGAALVLCHERDGQYHGMVAPPHLRKRPPPSRAAQRVPPELHDWNPRAWDWNSRELVAVPVAAPAETPKSCDHELQLRLGREEAGVAVAEAIAAEEATFRSNKRVRPASPAAGTARGGGTSGGSGSGGTYPTCQVDNCRTDLSNAKDYHRRHKVCDMHSKASEALVARQMQRFCQQCSRFHPLLEFDEGKRSCRRRLAGHNRRRRKTQTTDVTSQPLLLENKECSTNNLDIVSLLSVLVELHGKKNADNVSNNPPSTPEKSSLAHILNEINSLGSAIASARTSAPAECGSNEPQQPQQEMFRRGEVRGDKQDAASATNIFGSFPEALPASSREAESSHLPGGNVSSDSHWGNTTSPVPACDGGFPGRSIPKFLSSQDTGNNKKENFQHEKSPPSTQDDERFLSLRLFTTAEDVSPPNVDSAVKYVSSESSNPMDDRSPSSSPPVTHQFFPLHPAVANNGPPVMEEYVDDTISMEASTCRREHVSLSLFTKKMPVENGSPQNLSYPAGWVSTSGSDRSLSSSNSDVQDRTGRIIFKLFGKDPSNIPVNLRDQMQKWLRQSPSEMEGYIRPGCVVLYLYLLMPSDTWDELEENLLGLVNSLIYGSNSDFWLKGRFLVRSNKQLVSHKDGMIHLSRSWETFWSTPELISVSPVAVVAGQRTSLVLKGRNLTIPGTKIHCTYKGKFISKEVSRSACTGTVYDHYTMETFDFPGECWLETGRCFIEVENGFKGNSFPLLVASSSVCQELRTLEAELDAYHSAFEDGRQSKSKDNIIHFLNELGWLFQNTYCYSKMESVDFPITRFKYLLVFSIERDWCALTKDLLDLLAGRSLNSPVSSEESLDMLHEIHLLNRAVRRKSWQMVIMLLHYSIACSDNSLFYPFVPNMPGPRGLTPLHIAASAQGSIRLVDALTDDPQKIGLNCWNSTRDDAGNTPQVCAVLAGNNAYNELVARKLAENQIGVSIAIDKEEIHKKVAHLSIYVDTEDVHKKKSLNGSHRSMEVGSCALCTSMEARLLRGHCSSRRGVLTRPYVCSILAVAAVCVCVCVFVRVLRIHGARSFKWESVRFGTM